MDSLLAIIAVVIIEAGCPQDGSYPNQIAWPGGVGRQAAEPVSYTHLDVYKRQREGTNDP